MSEVFDTELCNQLREAVNRTDIFYKDKVQSEKFDFICAFMDRFDFAVNYLNNHNTKPQNEIDFMTFLTQASIVRDGIKLCYELVDLKEVPTTTFFKEYCLRDIGSEPENDDKYYEYFRSLGFAHPLNTSWSIPNRIANERQFSPFCLMDLHNFRCDKDTVGVMVYSDKRENFSLTLPYAVLIDYLKYKYSLLTNIIAKFNEIIETMEANWKKRKVNREQDNLSILREVSDILEERYLDHDNIDSLIEYLETELTIEDNRDNVGIFRHAILKLIPSICDAVDEYRIDDLYDICNSVLYRRPNAHQMLHYQLENIFCYLNTNASYNNEIEYQEDNCQYSNVQWGIIQADAFSKEFAKKWVIIKPYEMNFREIRLLTEVACYLEYMEQNSEVKNNEQ